MTQVRAIKNFPGSSINRDELGVVTEGSELQVSPNDATFLEREGLVERIGDPVIEEPVAAAEVGDPAGGPSDQGKEPAGAGTEQS